MNCGAQTDKAHARLAAADMHLRVLIEVWRDLAACDPQAGDLR